MNKEYFEEHLGTTINQALDDDSALEIMLNPNGDLWVQYFDDIQQVESNFPMLRAKNLVQSVAKFQNRYLNEKTPILTCELPFYNARISIVIPPITSDIAFNIRKHCTKQVKLNEYREQNVMSEADYEYLKEAIRSSKNILVSGGPGSGKTTLTNALLNEVAEVMPKGHRVLILEDTNELQTMIKHNVFLKTSTYQDMTQLVKFASRAASKSIVIGEVVDGTALDMLKAWNMGCPGGLATIHANSAFSTLQRVEDLAMEKSLSAPRNLIGEAIDVIVHIKADYKHPSSRVVTGIIEINGFDLKENSYLIKTIH